MLSDKGTNIFSEIGKFFKENDATSAMNAIIDTTKALRLSEKRLFGSKSKCNCKLTQLQVFGLLMLFPCFMIRNAYNYGKSSLSSLFDCRKDVFYRFISNESYDWRRILATVSLQLWNKTQESRSCESAEPWTKLWLYTAVQTGSDRDALVRFSKREVPWEEVTLVDGHYVLEGEEFADDMKGWALVLVKGERCSPQTIVTRCTLYKQYTTEDALETAADSYGGLTDRDFLSLR